MGYLLTHFSLTQGHTLSMGVYARLYDVFLAGENEVYVRKNTALETYKNGKQYCIVSMKFGKYVAEMRKGTKLSKNMYLAVQNIKKAFPQLQVRCRYYSVVHARMLLPGIITYTMEFFFAIELLMPLYCHVELNRVQHSLT